MHQVEAAPAAFFQAFGTGWVRYLFRIEPWAFIRYPDGERIAQVSKGNAHPFGTVASVAMQDGVGDGFGEADEYVAVNVRGKMVALGDRVDKRLNFGNIGGVGL